jgi:hypothetical protein
MFNEGDQVRIKGKTVNSQRGSLKSLDQTVFKVGDIGVIRNAWKGSGVCDVWPLDKEHGGASFLLEDLELVAPEKPLAEGTIVKIKGKTINKELHSFTTLKEIGAQVGDLGRIRFVTRNHVGIFYDVKGITRNWCANFLPQDLEVLPVKEFMAQAPQPAPPRVPEPEEPREYAAFSMRMDNKGQPKEVRCYLHSADGKIHLGVSRCNKDAGDTFTKKEGRRLARKRAECARDTHLTASFPNGGLCMACDYHSDEKGDQ